MCPMKGKDFAIKLLVCVCLGVCVCVSNSTKFIHIFIVVIYVFYLVFFGLDRNNCVFKINIYFRFLVSIRKSIFPHEILTKSGFV